MSRRFLLLLFVFLSLPCTALAQAKVREYKKTIPTYAYSDPNPIPVMGKIYPYFRYDLYAENSTPKEWTIVELENDYLIVRIMPEIGGKIWTAIEKSTGKPFIYDNQVVKFRDIAMRGPWTSGGIEANYGIIGHTPNCATPVDYLVRQNEDGSVSCFIGVLDLLTRTPWRLEINLPADKAYFTTSSFWYNASPFEQPYYTWMNAGIKAAGNLQFIYPGTHYLGHDGEYASWPMHEKNGKNLSYYEQNNFGGYKSYHVFGKYTDFFGGYWHNDDFGMARYSERDEKAGKKIWIWGLSRQGMIWEQLLTDADGQYVEVQSGRLFNQSAERSTFTPFKHRGFAPYATDRWTEYWFPVKGTRGFVRANPYGALNLQAENGEVKIAFSPVQRIDDLLEVFDGDRLIYSKPLALKPMQIFSDSVKATVDPKRLRARLGRNKLEYDASPAADVMRRPIESPKEFHWDSAYGMYLQGKEHIRQRQYPQAKQFLEDCLKKEKHYAPALSDLAMLEYRNLHYDVALDLARKALAIDTYDPAANYYYGLINLALGHITDAKDGFELASNAIEYRSAAWTELGKIYFREGKDDKALSYATQALDFNRQNLDAMQTLAVLHRRANRRERAQTILNEMLRLDPLNHFARFEKGLGEGNLRDFPALIRNEMPHETYLELAAWYDAMGLRQDAAQVLALAPSNAEVLYWRAYLQQQPGMLPQANAASPHLVFPFRAESARVLKWAAENSSDWHPKYYLALLYWSRDDVRKAGELLKSCGTTPDYAPFYAMKFSLSMIEVMGDDPEADLKRALQLDPGQWRYAKLLAGFYNSATIGEYEKALSIAKAYYEKTPENYQLATLYALCLVLNKQYAPALDLLGKTNFLPFEGSTEVRNLYREANLMLAVERLRAGSPAHALDAIATARKWPENLGAGQPYAEDLDERLEDWLEADARELLKQGTEAKAALERILARNQQRNDLDMLLHAMTLKKLGRAREGTALLEKWAVKKEPMLLSWFKGVYQGSGFREGAIYFSDLESRVIDRWQAMQWEAARGRRK